MFWEHKLIQQKSLKLEITTPRKPLNMDHSKNESPKKPLNFHNHPQRNVTSKPPTTLHLEKQPLLFVHLTLNLKPPKPANPVALKKMVQIPMFSRNLGKIFQESWQNCSGILAKFCSFRTSFKKKNNPPKLQSETTLGGGSNPSESISQNGSFPQFSG